MCYHCLLVQMNRLTIPVPFLLARGESAAYLISFTFQAPKSFPTQFSNINVHISAAAGVRRSPGAVQRRGAHQWPEETAAPVEPQVQAPVQADRAHGAPDEHRQSAIPSADTH